MEVPAKPTRYAEHATRYRVSERTIMRWSALGAPLGDDAKMLAWGAQLTVGVPVGFRNWMHERRGHEQPSADAGSQARDPTWQEFLAQAQKKAETAPKESLHEIARARDFAAFRFRKAAEADNRPDMKTFADLLAKFEGVVHDAELRAKKLGIDAGELLPRPEVERMAWAVAFWSMQSVNAHLDSLEGKLRTLAPGLEGSSVRSVLEGELLSARFLEPFARASSIRAGVALPEWLVAQMRRACGDFLERGEEAFDHARGETA